MFNSSNRLKNSLKNNLWLAASTILIGSTLFNSRPALSQQDTPIFIAQNLPDLKAESAQSQTLYLNNDRTYSYNLVAQERGTIDGIVIPAGATIVGKYVPVEGGLRYVAEAVTYDNYSYSINAASGVIKSGKDPRDTSAGAIAKDAGIGAAGGTILGEVFGDAGAAEIIGGAAAGAATGNLTADSVVVVEPNRAIALYE